MPAEGRTRRGSLRLQVYQQLRDWIIQGHYADGMALTELSVSRSLGVSRTPVREAFRQLELDGLVVCSPNRSVTVHCFSDQEILDLYEVRNRMESLAAARAAINMTDEQRHELKDIFFQAVHAKEKDAKDLARLQTLDEAFHNLVFTGSGSTILQAMLVQISQKTRQARLVSLAKPGRCHEQIAEHKHILDAILNKDSQDAETKMRRHIARAADSYRVVGKQGRST